MNPLQKNLESAAKPPLARNFKIGSGLGGRQHWWISLSSCSPSRPLHAALPQRRQWMGGCGLAERWPLMGLDSSLLAAQCGHLCASFDLKNSWTTQRTFQHWGGLAEPTARDLLHRAPKQVDGSIGHYRDRKLSRMK